MQSPSYSNPIRSLFILSLFFILHTPIQPRTMHRQKTPYSRPIPTSGHTVGGPDGSANNSSYLTAASRERQAPPLPPDPVQPYSNYTLNSPQTPQPSPYQPYSQQQRPAVATYSAQAMRTFAPQQQFPVVTPEAAMVPIRSLQPEKSFVVSYFLPWIWWQSYLWIPLFLRRDTHALLFTS